MNFYTSNSRKIGVTNRSVSGAVPDIGSYESSLERDFMELQRFDDMVEKIIPQPLTIGYFSKCGRSRRYTPDGLLCFHEKLCLPPILYEIKYREDFRENWKNLIPKYRAAKKSAIDKGWCFKIFTEKEIRTPYLSNIKFLFPYKKQKVELELEEYILSIMNDLEEADPAVLSFAICSSNYNRAMIIPVIWHLIAVQKIGCDLTNPLTMNTRIWSKKC